MIDGPPIEVFLLASVAASIFVRHVSAGLHVTAWCLTFLTLVAPFSRAVWNRSRGMMPPLLALSRFLSDANTVSRRRVYNPRTKGHDGRRVPLGGGPSRCSGWLREPRAHLRSASRR
jgi:hypothetical protein